MEIVEEYKYLGIIFHNRLNLEACGAKRIQGGWRAFYLLQNRCRELELWDRKTKKALFGLLVTLVVLYGCEFWGRSMSDHKWRQLERIQKHLITNNFKFQSTVLCETLLVEASLFPMETKTVFRLLSYLKKV